MIKENTIQDCNKASDKWCILCNYRPTNEQALVKYSTAVRNNPKEDREAPPHHTAESPLKAKQREKNVFI